MTLKISRSQVSAQPNPWMDPSHDQLWLRVVLHGYLSLWVIDQLTTRPTPVAERRTGSIVSKKCACIELGLTIVKTTACLQKTGPMLYFQTSPTHLVQYQQLNRESDLH